MDHCIAKFVANLIDDVLKNRPVADFDDFLYIHHKDPVLAECAKSLRSIIEQNKGERGKYISDLGLKELEYFKLTLLGSLR